MSKLQLKIKTEKGNFVLLNNIKSLRLTIHNGIDEVKSTYSYGWKTFLNYSGTKHITMKINGVLDCGAGCELADQLLRNSIMLNSVAEYEIEFDSDQGKMKLYCCIESYERYYDPSTFDTFSVSLKSTGIVGDF